MNQQRSRINRNQIKYLKPDDSNSVKIKVNIYIMEINFLTNEYKDVREKGKKKFKLKIGRP